MKENDYKMLRKVIDEVGKTLLPNKVERVVKMSEKELNQLLELYLWAVLNVCDSILLNDKASK